MEDAAQVAELNSRLTKLRVTIEGLEKERNFYFGYALCHSALASLLTSHWIALRERCTRASAY